MMTAAKYKFLLWEFIAALDSGKHDNLAIGEVRQHARNQTIASFLQSKFSDLDFSIIESEDWKELTRDWHNLDNAIDARRKFGVENKGISLILAFTLQSFQSLEREGRQ
ncbi:hypothetical protein DNX69_23440 [Rhodopseudomonas palustris]|uniref:Uncharacterized protein n=1 Tax=Rhodopseudomonas palustris TaxID=1076 RepID=A0A323UAV3_RHOPL|nr:hypothetical protein [Rhodopseudomonas palustris]PZA09501.1 hypothetical protein DNX69_23440 [Rhodopseudomonas palustris]